MLLKTKLDHTLSSIFGNCREKQTTTKKKNRKSKSRVFRRLPQPRVKWGNRGDSRGRGRKKSWKRKRAGADVQQYNVGGVTRAVNVPTVQL